MGARAMRAQTCFVSPSGRGAIARGRAAVKCLHLDFVRPVQLHLVILGTAVGFVAGWISCFFWLLIPTVVYEP